MSQPDGRQRFEATIAAIDAANADDPATLTLDGVLLPKELTHAEMMSRWVRFLDPDASEELLLAARAHHVRRWMIPRTAFPAGRSGYLRWRRALHRVHAELAAAILEDRGYGRAAVERVFALIAKEPLLQQGDPDAQTLEDALSLVFFDTQLAPIVVELDERRLRRVIGRTWRKMSGAGRQAARGLTFDAASRDALERIIPDFTEASGDG